MPQARNPGVRTLEEEKVFGETVWDACGEKRLQAQRGQQDCSESGTGYCAGADNVELDLLTKGLQEETETDISLKKTRPP